MRMWIGIGIGLLLTACAAVPKERSSNAAEESPNNEPDHNTLADVLLEDFGPAPELQNDVWLNTDEPLRLVNLSGQVVLLDMWTFG